MKLDLLFEVQPIPELWEQGFPHGQRKAEQEAYRRMFEQVELADKLGFQTAWFVEHHCRERISACATNEAVLGGLARSTDQIRLGFGVTLMPPGFQHPIRVAEKVATVDIMSGGRVEWGTGRSTVQEQHWFGVPTDDRSTDQWREAVEFVVRAWEQERISWDSETFSIPDVRQGPKPFQDPHPPVWLAIASPSSAIRAGASGIGLLSFSHLETLEDTAEKIRGYRKAYAECTTPLTRVWNDRVASLTFVHCAEDMDDAEAYGVWEAANYYYTKSAEFVLGGIQYMPPDRREAMRPVLEAMAEGVDWKAASREGRVVIGTPEQCLEKMLRIEAAGVDELVCFTEFGGLRHDKVIRSLQLIGDEVIPELERRGHRFDYAALARLADTTASI